MSATVTRATQCLVYSCFGGTCAAYLTLSALYDPTFLLWGLCGAVVLAGGMLSTGKPERGRIVATIGILGLLPEWWQGVIYLVPEHARIFTPIDLVILLSYVAVVGFAFFFPRRHRFSTPAFLLILILGSASYAITYSTRAASGEYHRPVLECYRWQREPADDLIVDRTLRSIPDYGEFVAFIERAGVRGTVTATGGGDYSEVGTRLIVLAQSKPPADSKLFFPKSGWLVYAFDGTAWHKFPPAAPTYPLYASFRDDRDRSMICRTRPDGGAVCSAGLSWE